MICSIAHTRTELTIIAVAVYISDDGDEWILQGSGTVFRERKFTVYEAVTLVFGSVDGNRP
jgi:hypothetical protein